MDKKQAKRDLIIFVSPASSGKDYILNKCIEQFGWHKVVSHTTRTPRIGEKNGIDYWFVNPLEFNEMNLNDEFIETTKYKTTDGVWEYGFHKSSINIDGIKTMIVNPNGIDQFLEKGYGERLMIIYINSTTDTRIERYFKRLGDNPTQFQLAEGFLRLLRDIEDFEKFDEQIVCSQILYDEYYYKGIPLHYLPNNDYDCVEYEIEGLVEFISEVNHE